MKNERGLTGLEILVIVAAAGALFTFVPQINPINLLQRAGGSAAVKAPEEEVWKEQEEHTIPRTVGVTETGEKVIAFERVKTFRSGASKSPGKLTYGERIGQFFSGLTIWGIIALAFAFFVLGITPGMIFARLKKRAQIAFENEKSEKEKVRQALTNTVLALQGVDDETWKTKLKPLLEASQDKQDRDLIRDIKKEIDK